MRMATVPVDSILELWRRLLLLLLLVSNPLLLLLLVSNPLLLLLLVSNPLLVPLRLATLRAASPPLLVAGL